MRRIFWGFCRNWFLMSPLHYLSGRSDFGFEFAEIFVFEKRVPTITDTGSRRLPVSLSWRVNDSPHHWYAESGDSLHHRYGESAIEFLKRKLCIDDTKSRRLPAPVIWWVADSPHQWYGESPTPHIVESESRWLRVSPIQRVDDSVYRWVGESTTPRIGDTGSCYSKKN